VSEKILKRGQGKSERPRTRRHELISATMLLEDNSRTSPQNARPQYVIAATLCAHAAVECVLSEWALLNDPSTCARILEENWPFMRTAEELLPKVTTTLPRDLLVLTNVRNALCLPSASHDEVVDHWLANNGAQRAVAVALFLESQFFPDGVPAVSK
jgi:hypothetical protein